MSVLQTYLNWANSVLSGLGSTRCTGVSVVQQGKIICQLIDHLCPEAELQRKAESSTNVTAHVYLRTALDHMRNHGIKFHFTPQDILDGDIKSILDVLWLIILNYAVHNISSSPYQRSVGIGKKVLLDWCQNEVGTQFDPQNSLTYNLCTGDWFLKLLSKCTNVPINDAIDREENLKKQLINLEFKNGIKQDLITPSDITEGTVDEHTLMIYVSLLRLKFGDTVDVPLKTSSELSFKPIEKAPQEYTAETSKSIDVPSIILSDVDDNTQSPGNTIPPLTTQTSGRYSTDSSPAHSPPYKRSSEGTDQDTSDWMSQSSGSPISSTNEKSQEHKSQEVNRETDLYLKETISEQIREHILPHDEDMPKTHGSRIPVKVKQSEERAMSSPGRMENKDQDKQGQSPTSRKISVKVQRPRSPNSIMAEARMKQEQEKEKRKREKDEAARLKKEDENVYTGSASESGEIPQAVSRLRPSVEADPVKSDEDDIVKEKPLRSSSPYAVSMGQMNGDIQDGRDSVPVFVMPNKKHDMELLLEALKHARTEANAQDALIQASMDQPDFKQVVDKNIEQLEAQLAAVKAQSKEMFKENGQISEPEIQTRGRAAVREPRRGERRSPPRGILDMMANQSIDTEETTPKERVIQNEEPSPPAGILRYRSCRSPTDHAGKFSRENLSGDRIRPGSRSPDKFRPMSPHERVTKEEQDADKRLIKYLTNEIDNMKLKMAVIEQKGRQRTPSPYGMGPRVTAGLPERDLSPAQVSSRVRAKITDFSPDVGLSSYSPLRRGRPNDLLERSRSPRFDSSPTRSLSRSPARSPTFRSRIPDTFGRDKSRSISPSVRVLSLQDLSTSITDDPDGKVTFAPASGARPVDLGYSSPIRKVNQEIWGHGQTEDDYFADTAKYEQWKRLISRDAVCDEDMLELKQALASALVEIDIIQAKLKNANDDIKLKMGKTTDVLNDCRAHLTKSQAENAELRTAIEKEKSKNEAQEVRLREMEENLQKSKTNVDDKTLELEESVLTLKGIVNLDKNQIVQLEQENDKLRKKISEFQRENIKLKEDFNELKIYNDKAQVTIKDLKSCLEDAKTERKQLFAEIKRMKEQGKSNTISGIINHYMEKGLYEEQEKEPIKPMSRTQSPIMFDRSRSTSPVRSRPVTPIRCFSPVRSTSPNPLGYNSQPLSRSQSPTPGGPEYSPSDGHEIYPHRRTKSYVQKFGAQDEDLSRVDLNDPEIQEFLKPKTRLTYDLDDSYSPYTVKSEDGPTAKRKLLYSPYMDKDFVPKSQANVDNNKYKTEEPESFKPSSHRKTSYEEEVDDNRFMKALDNAVKESPSQLAQKRFLQDLDRVATSPDKSPERWRSPNKGILKSNKSIQNMSIKENMPIGSRRAVESRSFSPIARSNMSRQYSPVQTASRSYTPDARLSSSPYTSTPKSRPLSPGANRNRSYSSGNVGQRTHSPGAVGQRSYSPASTASRSYSPGVGLRGTRDSGYSTPTQPGRLQPRQHHLEMKNPSSPKQLLSEDERRYADLLIDKYTRQQFIGVLPFASKS